MGGGTAPFTDRPSISNADYSYTPIYSEVATFRIPTGKINYEDFQMKSLILVLIAEGSDFKGTPLEQCQEPVQSGKGYWIEKDLRFGYGLNVARTRHASEIVKTVGAYSNRTISILYIFGGYNL